MEDNFVKLTNTVYTALEFFPESEPLKSKAKERALSIMEILSLGEADEKANAKLAEDIELLLNYLKLAQLQGWISNMNYLIIRNEYEKIKPVAKAEVPAPVEKPLMRAFIAPPPLQFKKPDIEFYLSARQQKILDFLRKNEQAQVGDLQAVLTDVTKRTIRRDLDNLLKMGRIVRAGEWNRVVYKISRG